MIACGTDKKNRNPLKKRYFKIFLMVFTCQIIAGAKIKKTE